MNYVTEKFALSTKRKDRKKWGNYKYCQLDGNDEHDKFSVNATNEEIELDSSFHSGPTYRGRGRYSKCRTTRQESAGYVEHSIKEGETLQKLSLLYGCSVAELKKANRLLNCQEFYALKSIRIPIKQFSLLTEILPVAECRKETERNDEQVRTFHLGISQVLNGEKKSESAVFLEKMDEDLTRIRESTKNYKDSLDEVAETLTSPQFKPVVENKTLICSGADYGLQWKSLVCVIIIFIFVLPIACIVYLRTTTPAPVGNYSEPGTL